MLNAFAKKLADVGVSPRQIHQAIDLMEHEGMSDEDIEARHQSLDAYLNPPEEPAKEEPTAFAHESDGPDPNAPPEMGGETMEELDEKAAKKAAKAKKEK